MKILTDQYLAGLFDGEGSVTVVKYHPKYSPNRLHYVLRVHIANTNKELMDLLVENLGGFYRSAQGKKEWKVDYQWALSADKAFRFLKSIYPHLVIKQKQADVAFEFINFRKNNVVVKKKFGTSIEFLQQYELYYMQMKKLNQRGVII